jgi:hypothetical protein
MKINELFVNEIDRYIDPVIKIEDEKNVLQELEEYVVTDKIAENLITFFEKFNETAQHEKKDIGVWISGFFGSGKSHFAKILGYLLENKQIDGRAAHDIFLNRIKGLDREMEIKSLLHEASLKIKAHSIMYQIEAEHDQLAEKKSISKTIYKQFLKYQGLSEDLHIAELEQDLIIKGKYQEFKDKIKSISGHDWIEVRKSPLFAKKPISKALYNLFPENFNSEDEAKVEFEKYNEKIELTIAKLARKIRDYIQLLEKNGESSPHIVFIIDEMGQYIGDSDELLLELQTLAEEFGKTGLGRTWLIVTSQERLDQVIEGVKKKEEGYKKIMDRFETKLHLTSENIVAVLEERILKKKERALPEISSIYSKYEGTISYASKIEGANRHVIECNEDNFIMAYPFLPYQLEITQQIFANIRSQAGHSIKLTGAERSMLGVTQGILKSPETGFKTNELGRLVTFDEIFDQIRTEIPSDILKDINGIKVPVKGDTNLSKKTIKALFLLQQLRWIPKSLTNISRAMVPNTNANITSFESNVKSALDELVKGKYVIFENEQYEYISGSKKLIEEEISREPVKNHEIKRFAKEQLITILEDLSRLNYESVKYFDIHLFGDDEELSSKGDISLKVYSPIFLEFKTIDKATIIDESHRSTDTVFWLSNLDIKVENDISKYLRTQKVIERRDKNEKKSAEEIAILREKRESLEALRSGIESSIKQALISGNIIHDGNDEVLTGKTDNIKTIFERELGKVVPFIYTKFDEAKFKVNEKSIAAILSAKSDLNQIEKELDLFDKKGNLNLHGKILSEVYSKIKSENDKAAIYAGADLLNDLEEVPYGWDVILVRIAVAALYRGGAIYLKFNGEPFYDYKKQGAIELLINSNKFKKANLCIEPEVEIKLEDREKAQQSLNIIFNVKTDDTINSLSQNIEAQLSTMISDYEKQDIYWEQNNLELKPEFYKIRETCEKVLNETNPAKKLKKFLELAEETKKEFKYLAKIKDFTGSEDKKLIAKVKKLPASINVSSQTIDNGIIEGFRSYKNEIDTIILNKEIVEKWTVALENYNRAVEAYKQVYEILHSQSYAIYDNMKKETSKDSVLAANIKKDTFDSINDFLCSENSWVADELKCKKCGYSLSELDNHILAKDTFRDNIILKLTPKKPEEKRVHVNLKSSTGKAVIRNDADLKEALSNIEKKVKVHLDKGETVLLQ